MLCGDKSIQDILKENIKNYVYEIASSTLVDSYDLEDTVVLYHGTNSVYLNDILENGIKPRELTGNHNWKESEKTHSNEKLVYLTNKWHYKYAYISLNKMLEEKYGDELSSNPKAQWWQFFNPLPIYIY